MPPINTAPTASNGGPVTGSIGPSGTVVVNVPDGAPVVVSGEAEPLALGVEDGEADGLAFGPDGEADDGQTSNGSAPPGPHVLTITDPS